ncbi:MAG: SH3 domain-containing protein [Dehalococcoidia bacterium]|nr:SH3 domain-containing protein [Dehalococcoidia bacterium]
MPLSQPRLALAGILLSVITAFAVFGSAKAAPPASSPIVDRALQNVDGWGGQCWTWMQQVVFEATGKKVGYDYRLGFFEAGAVEVTDAEAGPGDVIQIADDAWTSPDAEYDGLHTAIILENLGGGAFKVIDSNSQWDEVVRVRDSYNPSAIAAARGLNYHIYRLAGTPPVEARAAAPAAPVAPAGPLKAGDAARVNTPGETLNLRAGPGISSDVFARLPDGTPVTVLEAPRTIGSYSWVKVRTDVGDGYVAAQYLVRQTATAPASGTGDSRPILIYRGYVPGIATGD